MEKLYRVTYNDKGIYNELKRIVGKDTWLSLLSLKAFTWLPKPPSYSIENRSYFTKKGFEKFTKETLPIMYKYLDRKKIKIETFNNIQNIMYEDEYQVIEKK